MKGETRRTASCGHWVPCGCRMGSKCCSTCKMPICVFDMTETQRVHLSHLSRKVNTAYKKPTEAALMTAKKAAAMFLHELTAARKRLDKRPGPEPVAVIVELNKSCPRCSTRLRIEYEDLFCPTCGYREPAIGSSFEERGWSTDSELWCAAHMDTRNLGVDTRAPAPSEVRPI